MDSKRSLSPEARSIINSKLSRRALIAGAGGLGAAGLLTACGGGDGGSAENAVRWGNWPLYLDFDEESKTYPTLVKFSEQTGIDAKYFEDYNDNDEFFGKVQAQLKLGEDIGYDVVTPTDWMAARWIRLGYAQKFDSANIPNKSNILDSLAAPSYDSMRESTHTWQGIMGGFGWNVEKNPKGIRTLDDLFAPQNKGKIVVLTEMRDTIGVILLAQGVDITKVTEDQFMNAVDGIMKLSPEIVPPDSGIAKSNLPSFSEAKMNISPDQPITAVASPEVRSSAYSLPLTPRIQPSEIFLAMKSTAFIN